MGRINRINKSHWYNPTDDAGNELGKTSNRYQAEYMAESGYVSQVETIGQIFLWPMWNDAIDSGNIPLEDTDGTQFLYIFEALYMSAKKSEFGWNIDIMDENTFYGQYRSSEFPQVLKLTYTKKPLRLE